jgi:hypothetical protein
MSTVAELVAVRPMLPPWMSSSISRAFKSQA